MNNNMNYCYKTDWQEAKQRMQDWWEGKKVDRSIARITAPLPSPDTPRSTKMISEVPGIYTDPEIIFNNLNCTLEHTFWGAEAFPRHFVYLGPMFAAACLGCRPVFTENTTWYESPYKNLDDLVENFRFDEKNEWWRLLNKITDLSARRSHGQYVVTQNNICNIIDILAELIGTENLLVAMMEEPEKVKSIRDKIAALGESTFSETIQSSMADKYGYMDWLGVWSNRKLQTCQCDTSVMISPEMFRDFVLDDLNSTYEYLDYGMYHLDGEEEIQHLDFLLKIEKLKVIQWIPSTRMNQPEYGDPLNWLELFKRIQDGGKSVLIYTPYERVDELMQKVDRSKVILDITCPDVTVARKTLLTLDRIGV